VRIKLQIDNRKWNAKIRKIQQQLDGEIEKAVAQAVRNTSAAAKMFVVVDKGGLKSSIRPYHRGKNGEVVVRADYAPFVEFGTGSKVVVPTELKDYAMQFKGKGIRDVNLPARPYLYPAFFIHREKFVKDCENRLKKLA